MVEPKSDGQPACRCRITQKSVLHIAETSMLIAGFAHNCLPVGAPLDIDGLEMDTPSDSALRRFSFATLRLNLGIVVVGAICLSVDLGIALIIPTWFEAFGSDSDRLLPVRQMLDNYVIPILVLALLVGCSYAEPRWLRFNILMLVVQAAVVIPVCWFVAFLIRMGP